MTIENYSKIISLQNDRIKLLEKLTLKKYRREFKQFIVENLVIIVDALKAGYDFETLFITEEFASKHREQLEYIKNKTQAKNFYLIDAKLNKHYSNLDTPSGITAIYSIRERVPDKTSVIYLNGISDPGNLGTIMRSALAFDFINLVVDETCVDIYNPKVISAAKDAIFKLNIVEDNGDWLKNNKLPLYITHSHLGLDLDQFKPAKIFCLVLGNESHGINPGIMKLAEKSLKIKCSSKIESLNVAAAAAIFLYEFRQNN